MLHMPEVTMKNNKELTMRASVLISARIQSGQSKSPQKRNLWQKNVWYWKVMNLIRNDVNDLSKVKNLNICNFLLHNTLCFNIIHTVHCILITLFTSFVCTLYVVTLYTPTHTVMCFSTNSVPPSGSLFWCCWLKHIQSPRKLVVMCD
jgi:hypothetical protein